jgi:hypothetical protein
VSAMMPFGERDVNATNLRLPSTSPANSDVFRAHPSINLCSDLSFHCVAQGRQ